MMEIRIKTIQNYGMEKKFINILKMIILMKYIKIKKITNKYKCYESEKEEEELYNQIKK
jgi:hypothetical protein